MSDLQKGDFVSIKTYRTDIQSYFVVNNGIIDHDFGDGYFKVNCILDTGNGSFVNSITIYENLINLETCKKAYKLYAMELLKT